MPALPGLGVTRFAARGSTRLTYEDVGNPAAPVVVALHDLLADRAVWRPLAEHLVAAGWRVVAIDARGHGASAALGVRPYPPTELAADVLAVLDGATDGPVHIVGHGWGAATALTVARFDPGRIASLALLQPDLPGLLAADDDPVARRAAGKAAAALAVAARAAGTGQTDRALDALLDPRWGTGWRDRLPKPRLAAIKRYGGSLGALLTGAEGHEPDAAVLAALAMPALVMRCRDAGELDALVSDRLVAAFPAARLAVTECEATPAGQLDPVGSMAVAAVLGFLEDVRPAAT